MFDVTKIWRRRSSGSRQVALVSPQRTATAPDAAHAAVVRRPVVVGALPTLARRTW